jgi:hypothetical protein
LTNKQLTHNIKGIWIPQHLSYPHISFQINASIHHYLSYLDISRHGIKVLNDGTISHWVENAIFFKAAAGSSWVFQ